MKGAVAIMVLLAIAMAQLVVKPSEAAIGCGEVASSLSPCMPYMRGETQDVSTCCQGAKKLVDMTQSKEDRQAACGCIKAAASAIPNLKPDVAAGIPQKCGITVNVPISPNVDCSTVSKFGQGDIWWKI